MKQLRLLSSVLIFGSLFILNSCDKCEFKGISTSELPEGKVGQFYSARINLNHTCNPEVEYFDIAGGTLPAGLGMHNDGLIEGIPALEGDYTFTLKVEVCFTDNGTDYSDCYETTKAFLIRVQPEK